MTSATTTKEIPRDEWPSFLDVFSKSRQEWLVTVEVFDTEIGNQVEAERMKLKGITFEHKGAGAPAILIMLGKQSGDHVTHQILNPSAVRLERSELESGTYEALQITCDDGPMTLVRFHAGVVPDGA